MAISCECRHCTTKFWAPDNLAGQKIACPVCERGVRVPGGPPPLEGSEERRRARGAGPGGPSRPPSLMDVLEEELGPGAALAAAAEEMAGPRTSPPPGRAWEPGYRGMISRRSMIRLSPAAALGVLAAGALAFYVLILLAAPPVGKVLSLLLFLTGMGVVFTGVCWHLYVALREETACFVWSIVTFPFYFLYFLMTRWEKTRKPFLVIFGGLVLCAGSYGGMLYADFLASPAKKQPATGTGKPGSGPGLKFKLAPDAVPGSTAAEPAGKPGPQAPAGPAPDAAVKDPAKKPTPRPKTPPDEMDYEPAKDLTTPPTEGWKGK